MESLDLMYNKLSIDDVIKLSETLDKVERLELSGCDIGGNQSIAVLCNAIKQRRTPVSKHNYKIPLK